MKGFTISLIILFLLMFGFLLGALMQSPALILGYLCLAPWAGFAAGRFSARVTSKVAMLNEHELALVESARTKK